jgi:hypothetical protein
VFFGGAWTESGTEDAEKAGRKRIRYKQVEALKKVNKQSECT